MSLPLKNDPIPSDPRESPRPKLVPIQSYDPEFSVEDAAEEEADFVLKRATESFAESAEPFREIGERITGAVDLAMQSAAASVRDGVNAARNLAEEEPIRFIAMVAGAAFVAGFILRMLRSSRA
jgi:hypothetical protein